MSQVDFKKAINNYVNALNNKNNNEIEKAKYDLLWEISNFFELVINYIVLSQKGINFDFGKDVIPKGTRLFRIRKYESNIDFSATNEWTAPPHRPQNRANFQKQEALYLGSTENICLLETHIKKNEQYVLGNYEVIENIEVGGFLCKSNNIYHNYAGMILNAFLIAPVRNEINKELFSKFDHYYGKLTLEDFTDMNELKEKGAFELPIKFGVLNQRDKYYHLTNKICKILSKFTPNGIRYSSCYLPLETIGIECTDYNIVLYHEGIKKTKFINYEIKKNNREFTGSDILFNIFLNKEG